MKVARITCATGEFTAVVLDEVVRLVGPADDATVLGVATSGRLPAGRELPTADVRFLSPVGAPPSIRDFYAFERHVATARAARGLAMEPAWYDAPAFYFSNPGALLGDGEPVHPPARTTELDFELEVAMVIGNGSSSKGAVAGYTIMNDWSARDLQRAEMQVGLGPAKGKDFATSLGPWLVTPDEFDPGAATMTASVNGREVSRGDLAELSWSFAEMACYAGESTALRPGDVLGSGTVGSGCLLELGAVHGREAYPWLTEGDVVNLAVEGLGSLTTTVGAASPATWVRSPREASRLGPRPAAPA